MIENNNEDQLLGKLVKLTIRDPDDERVKQVNPEYHPFETTTFGKIIKRVKGNYERWLYIIELSEILQEPGKPNTKYVVAIPAYKDAINQDLDQKKWAGIMLARPKNPNENFEGINDNNMKDRLTAVGSGIAKLFLE